MKAIEYVNLMFAFCSGYAAAGAAALNDSNINVRRHGAIVVATALPLVVITAIILHHLMEKEAERK